VASHPLSEQLIKQPDAQAREQLLITHADQLDDDLALALKQTADTYLRTNLQHAMAIATILFEVAAHSGKATHRALAFRARGNVYAIGLGNYEKALADYAAAVAIYQAQNDVVNAAHSQIGRLWALTSLSRYDEAEALAADAAQTLAQAKLWQPLALLTMNRAVNLGHKGDDIGALALFDKARDLLNQLGDGGKPNLPWIEQNRSIVLRNLGRLHESVEAAEQAWQGMKAAGDHIEAARAQQSMAIAYLLLGRYTEALDLMEEARSTFLADNRQRDAILLDLFLCDALLALRRFQDVLNITRKVRPFFAQRGMAREIGKALLDEAVAHIGLGQLHQARKSLIEARSQFEETENRTLVATADLELAALLLHLDELEESAARVRQAEYIFGQHNLQAQQAQAWLLQARIALRQQRWQQAERQAQRALSIAQQETIISLAFRARHLLGQAKTQRDQRWQAMAHYDQAIQHLERLHGYLMTEFQADFLEDKAVVYEDAILLAQSLQAPKKILELAERAKSRSLLAMLSNKIDLSLHARRPQDETIIRELTRLRQERNRILLRQETGEAARSGHDPRQAQHQIWKLEQQITQQWHHLLLHNADYARDASMWQVRTESPQPWLDDETLLVEYFMARGQLIAILVSKHKIETIPLTITPSQLTQTLTLLSLNNRTLLRAPTQRRRQLAENARNLLAHLYQHLLQPLQPQLAQYPRLLIVPHGKLHYLPFHALHDGQRYLIETREISYLPASSLIRFNQQPSTTQARTLSFGYSAQGLLPQTIEEAKQVAHIMGGQAFLEEDATLTQLKQQGAQAQVLHFATHGEFRADNPLFSGIWLADGWLTTLDIFNLHLDASLVTLSACHSGQHRIGGGDELLGLTRAFLYAGAHSLLLSFWQIPDAIAETLVTEFYRHLAAGQRKASALRKAQLTLLEQSQTDFHSHPFIWAPYFLTGSPNHL